MTLFGQEWREARTRVTRREQVSQSGEKETMPDGLSSDEEGEGRRRRTEEVVEVRRRGGRKSKK